MTIAIIGKRYMSFVKRGMHDQDGSYNCMFEKINKIKIAVLCTKQNRDLAYLLI